jgi:hypothetical protein
VELSLYKGRKVRRGRRCHKGAGDHWRSHKGLPSWMERGRDVSGEAGELTNLNVRADTAPRCPPTQPDFTHFSPTASHTH